MSSQANLTALPHSNQCSAIRPSTLLPRTWPPIVLLGIFWTNYSVLRWTEFGISLGFNGWLILLAVGALTTLLFAVWWLVASRVRWAERLLVFGTAVFAGVGVALLCDKSAGAFLLNPGLPLVLTAWTLGLVIVRKCRPGLRRPVLVGVLCLSWGAFLLIRTEGAGGDFQSALRWRWTLTPEEKYLAEGDHSGKTAAPPVGRTTLKLQPGDWPGFRGPNRDGNLRDVRIATDWEVTPPKLVWQRRIGPAWSSMVIVGDRLFTQEQLKDREGVICLDTANGRTLWSHQDAARHEDGQGGAGPRATPTFSDGSIFALGATGMLNCLDAASGDPKWSRDITADAGTKVPVWGFSSSPVVVGGLVVVFAGSEGSDSHKTLLAYHANSGESAWSASAGTFSYSSAQLALVGDETQLLFLSEEGLFAFDPLSGAVLWRHPTPSAKWGIPRVVQPCPIGVDRILFDAGADVGTALINLTGDAKRWIPKERWVSRQLKPSFNDFVVHENAIYGFDRRVFTCLDLETGKQRWKDGRYGSGQVLLLGVQPLLVVVTDGGEVVLVAANPDEHRELGRFKAVEGKTWNHPVIAHGRLFIRNAETIACYELQLEQGLANLKSDMEAAPKQ